MYSNQPIWHMLHYSYGDGVATLALHAGVMFTSLNESTFNPLSVGLTSIFIHYFKY